MTHSTHEASDAAADLAAPLFFYGSLRSEAMRAAVLGDEAARLTAAPATLSDAQAIQMPGEGFPVVTPAPGAAMAGVLVDGVSADGLRRLADYEGQEYEMRFGVASPLDGGGPQRCRYFAPTEAVAARALAAEGGPRLWDYESWAAASLERALLEARELARYADMAAETMTDRLWPDVKARAAAAVGAAAEPVGAATDRDSVWEVELLEPYRGFFGFQEVVARHRLFEPGGGLGAAWSPPLKRGVLRSGDGAVVLPYDPKTDRLMLIQQWRVGPWARGDAQPWCLEPVAGRIDPGSTAEETARREAIEEAGVTLGRIETIGGFYSTPGCLDEVLFYFAGEADLSARRSGEVFGLPHEGENIRTVVLAYEAAMTGLASGQITAGPSAIALLWLARNRERIRDLWV